MKVYIKDRLELFRDVCELVEYIKSDYSEDVGVALEDLLEEMDDLKYELDYYVKEENNES